MGYELWEDTVGGGGSSDWQTHTRTHPHFPCNTQGGWSLGQGSDAILTHVSVVLLLIKLMGYEHREDAMEGGGSKQCQIHTHTHTYSVLRDTQSGWSIGKDRTQF